MKIKYTVSEMENKKINACREKFPKLYVQSTPMKGSSQIFFRQLLPTNECKQRKFIHMKITVVSSINYDINII